MIARSYRWTAALCLAGTVALTACGGTSAKHPVPSRAAGPSVVMLSAKQPYRSPESRIALLDIKRGISSSEPGRSTVEPGQEWLGLKVRSCVPSGHATPVWAAWSTFSAATAHGERYPGLMWFAAPHPLVDNTWPLPQYPLWGQIAPGTCVQGWLLIPVQSSARVTRILYTAVGGYLRAEWDISGVANRPSPNTSPNTTRSAD